MKKLIKPVITMEASHLVEEAARAARLEFSHRREVIRLASQLQYVEDREELRDIENKLLRQTANMVFEMGLKEDAKNRMSDKELRMYRSLL